MLSASARNIIHFTQCSHTVAVVANVIKIHTIFKCDLYCLFLGGYFSFSSFVSDFDVFDGIFFNYFCSGVRHTHTILYHKLQMKIWRIELVFSFFDRNKKNFFFLLTIVKLFATKQKLQMLFCVIVLWSDIFMGWLLPISLLFLCIFRNCL